MVIRAHFDGKVIIPDEPISLPVNQELRVEVTSISEPTESAVIAERLARLALATGHITGPTVPLESMRRENLYEERL